jgi:hypothetical protein
VAERHADHFVDLGHAPRHRRDPFGREHLQPQAGALQVQAREQRLRHQRVADPVRGDDEDAGHQCPVTGAPL